RLLLFTHLVEPFRCAVAAISMARLYELVCVVLVEALALELKVSAIRTANNGTFIDIHSSPGEAIDEIFNCAFNSAFQVGIFDAQDKLSSRMASVKPAKEGGAKSTNVLKTGRAGSKAQARHPLPQRLPVYLCMAVDLCHICKISPLASWLHYRSIVT